MDEFEEKQRENHNEEIIERGRQVYEQYKNAGYSEEVCLQFQEDFIRENLL